MGPEGDHEVMRELAGLGVHFYPPSMLIRHAREIGLTPDQLSRIRQELLGTRAHEVDLSAKLEHARLEAVRLLAADKVDERAVGAQIDEATRAHAEMHKLRLGTMLRVHALLTPEQRQKIEERRSRRDGPKPTAGAAAPSPAAIGEAEGDDDDDDIDG
jgi:Spy/CpxP family protein refolding chaperone